MIAKGKKTRRKTAIGELLRVKRMDAGLTQKQLADRLGMEYYTMISQMENGYVPVPASLWLAIGEILDIPTERWLLLCLHEYLPEVYGALFLKRSKREVAAVLDHLNSGAMDEQLKEWFSNADLKDEDNGTRH